MIRVRRRRSMERPLTMAQDTSATPREKLKEALCRYTKNTLSYMDTVKRFCEMFPTWKAARETELTKLNKIKEKKLTKKKLTETELTDVLKETLGGLKKLDCFLDAVENLAVTSLHVFTERNQVLHLPEGISPEHVQVVITAARTVCPLLLEFKRDASVFFLPKLQNVEVLSYQLDRYIQTTQNICDKLQKRVLFLKKTTEPLVNLDADLPEEQVQRMLCHINQLDKIRKDQSFRTVFLFQKKPCSDFISEFSKRQTRMLQFLTELEETAVQLDRMNKGAKISSVAGSSVGAVGGVLSIVGLALIPVTFGASLALTMTGLGMGAASGVNSAVTTATEIGVNHTQQKKANETFKSFMKDVQSLQDCLEEVIQRETSQADVVLGAGKVLCKAGAIGNNAASAGKAAVKGPLALSKSARAGLIGLNALFLGMDIFFICKDSISLAKGSETELSQFIRARAALWSSEMDSWKKIHDFLTKGLLASEENKFCLETPFYPERKMKKCTDTEKSCVIL